MKRNKPLTKHRKASIQRYRRAAFDYDYRGASYWTLAVPQSFAGAQQTVFDITGAVPAGDRPDPANPRFGSVLRWKVDRGGKSAFVYGRNLAYGRSSYESREASNRSIAELFRTALPFSPDVYHVFMSERKGCTNGPKCPLSYAGHTDPDNNIQIAHHRPNRCPASVLSGSSVWRLIGRTVPDGQLIY